MKLTFIVTLAHFLLLMLFSLKSKPPEKKIPDKIIVTMLEEKTKIQVSPKETKKSKTQSQFAQPAQPAELEPLAEIAELEPLELNPLPVIGALPEHQPITTADIKIPEPKKETKPKVTDKKATDKPVEKKPSTPKPTAAKDAPKPKSKEVTPKPKNKPDTTKPVTTAKNVSGTSKPDETLIKLMKEGISKIDKIPNSIKGAKGGSSGTSSSLKGMKIAKLQSESLEKMTSVEISYAEELAMYIRNYLNFPEGGAMQLKLVLSDKGKVVNVSILSSSSSKNKEIGQKAIANIPFPAFGSRFPNEKSKSFTLQLNIE